MTERPIIFSGAMVRAIIEGRKTQTRRVVGSLSKRFPLVNLRFAAHSFNGRGDTYSGRFDDPMSWGWARAEDGVDAPLGSWLEWCPYGRAGDRLWVRETFCDARGHAAKQVLYRADGDPACRWTPAIHMPRAACRLQLEVTSVRVERLQALTWQDAEEEGVGHVMPKSAVEMYAELWDSLNAKRGFGWSTNPWVWVIEFKQ